MYGGPCSPVLLTVLESVWPDKGFVWLQTEIGIFTEESDAGQRRGGERWRQKEKRGQGASRVCAACVMEEEDLHVLIVEEEDVHRRMCTW